MATTENDGSEKGNKRSNTTERKAKKRKRKHHNNNEENSKSSDSLVNGNSKSPDNKVEQEENPSKADSEDVSFDSLLKANRTPQKEQTKLRLSPFKLPSPILKTPKRSAAQDNAKDKSLGILPSTPSPLNSSTKKVVQFKGRGDNSSDDDPDWSPPVKRRRSSRLSLKFNSRRHSQSPSGTPQSPKKVPGVTKLARISLDLLHERTKLPIWSARMSLDKMIKENQVTILLGETGSGKSTQLPQFLLQDYGGEGVIGITQPRRVAAINLARRVAEEQGTILRNKVGYSIRFDDATTSETRIKYLTDGMLLRELQSSRTLSNYSVIILDEAHERSLRTDLLMGLIKLILPERQDLRVIVMSATLDAERFSSFFEIDGKKSPIGFVQGREYPVDIFHTQDLAKNFDGTGSGDYLEGALKCIVQIHWGKEEGDILVFLTGQNEIESLESSLNFLKPEIPQNKDKLLICPLYAALPQHLQQKAFNRTPPGSRKIVLATNIAETSVTVPGVRFVIDCGLQKRRKFNPQLGIETLQIYPISKSSAAQRAGRAGREAPGACYRLYPQSSFDSLPDNTIPEIRECDITSLVLTLKIQGHDDILNFPFLDRPKRESVLRSLEVLYLLGALGRDGKPTELGREMNLLPLSPELAKVLLSASRGESSCVAEVIDIIACMSASSASSNAIFLTPKAEEREESWENRKHFASSYGDHITLLQAFREYLSVTKAGNVGVKEWCSKWGINRRVMKNVVEIQKQLISYCQRSSIAVNVVEVPDKDAILKAFLSGYIMNTAFLQLDGSYRTSFSHHTVSIHPSSVLFSPGNQKKIEAIMYHELVATTKNYVRGVSIIEADWLHGVAPGLSDLSGGVVSI